MKKPLGLDRNGVQKVMRLPDYLADSLGLFSLNAVSGLVGQLTYFYTEKVGLAAASVATAFIVVKILDAFTDLIMGNIIDHTKPGKERYRPWLLRAGIPMAVVVALLFMVPKNAGDTVKLAYMFITNLLATAVLYTAVSIPYLSLQVVRTNSEEERATMGSFRAFAGYIAGFIVAIVVVPVTNVLGGTQDAWIKVGVVFALVLALFMLIAYARAKETAGDVSSEKNQEVIEQAEEGENLIGALKKLFHNKYWVIVLMCNFFANVTYGLATTSGTYYAKWIYGDDNLIAIQGTLGLIPTIFGFATIAIFIKKLGVIKTLRVSFLVGVISLALRLINPTHFWYNNILGLFTSWADIPMMCLCGVLSAMAIDYNKIKYGKRMIGYSTSAVGFGNKISSGIGASLIGWLLGIAGYDKMGPVLTPAVRQAIYGFSIYVPLLMFIAMYLMIRQFDLEKVLAEHAAKEQQTQ